MPFYITQRYRFVAATLPWDEAAKCATCEILTPHMDNACFHASFLWILRLGLNRKSFAGFENDAAELPRFCLGLATPILLGTDGLTG